MKIDELLNPSSILLNFTAKNRTDTLEQSAQRFALLYPKVDQQALLKALVKREELGSTGIGSGVAIPHTNVKQIDEPKGLLAISSKGVEFKALDGELVHFLFLIVFPEGAVDKHLLTLSAVAKLLRDKFVRDSILNADSSEKVMSIFRQEELREKKPSFRGMFHPI